jgi:hypothetical protein
MSPPSGTRDPSTCHATTGPADPDETWILLLQDPEHTHIANYAGSNLAYSSHHRSDETPVQR